MSRIFYEPETLGLDVATKKRETFLICDCRLNHRYHSDPATTF